MNQNHRKESLIATYIIIIFVALHQFIPHFILSKFLSNYFETMYVSIIFIIIGITSVLTANYFSWLLKKYSNYKTLLTLCLMQILITFILPFVGNINLFLFSIIFISHVVFTSLIWSCVSIFLDEFSPTNKTGVVRGLSLAIYNFGLIISPFLAAKLFTNYDYFGIFIMSSLMILPIIFLSHKYLRMIKEPNYKHKSLWMAIKQINGNKDLHGVFISYGILCSFYAIMNIYFVLYLINEIRIPVNTYLGVITPIFSLPFILFPYEIGKLSDEVLGEKKLMIFGMSMVSIVLLSIYFFNINTSSVLIWATILFVSRIGAAINEIENYTYFYKKINPENSDLIYLFENMKYIALIFVSTLGLIVIDLFKFPIPTLLLIMGLLSFLSIFKISQIHDIKPKK